MNERFPKPKVIGGTAEEKQRVGEFLQSKRVESLDSIYGEDLLESTPEEADVIERAIDYVSEIANQHGAKSPWTAKRIAVVQSGSLDENGGGVSSSLYDTIAVERSESPVHFGRVLAHELFHKLGYNSFQVKESEDTDRKDDIYRSGVTMKSREGSGRYFHQANEAMAAEMASSFFTDVLSKEEGFQEEIVSSEALKSWMIAYFKTSELPENQISHNISMIGSIVTFPKAVKLWDMIQTSDKEDGYKIGYIIGFLETEFKNGTLYVERANESKQFKATLSRLVESDSTSTLTQEGLLDLFAGAHFTGNYLPLARKIDGALGVGTFRTVAKELGVGLE